MPGLADILQDGHLPVIIPAFNNPTYVRGIVDQLLRFPQLSPVVLDNGSTYGPAFDLYRSYRAAMARVSVFMLGQNCGPRATWQDAGFLHLLPQHFCITDPDLSLNPHLPDDFVATLIRITDAYQIGKAGFALSLSDADQMLDTPFRHAEGWFRIWESEAKHWSAPISDTRFAAPLYRAHIDTTFAVYNQAWFDPVRPFEAIRVAGRFTARHLPWYRDNGLPAEEEAHYRRSAEFSYYMGERPALQLRRLFALQDSAAA
jgi:hypothetical protein